MTGELAHASSNKCDSEGTRELAYKGQETEGEKVQHIHSIEYDSEGTRRLANKNKKDRKQREKRCKSH